MGLCVAMFYLPVCVCFRCVCPEGFEGDACEINIDDCEDNDCENNSTCVDGINNYTCMCSPEYTGNKHSAEKQLQTGCQRVFCCSFLSLLTLKMLDMNLPNSALSVLLVEVKRTNCDSASTLYKVTRTNELSKPMSHVYSCSHFYLKPYTKCTCFHMNTMKAGRTLSH